MNNKTLTILAATVVPTVLALGQMSPATGPSSTGNGANNPAGSAGANSSAGSAGAVATPTTGASPVASPNTTTGNQGAGFQNNGAYGVQSTDSGALTHTGGAGVQTTTGAGTQTGAGTTGGATTTTGGATATGGASTGGGSTSSGSGSTSGGGAAGGGGGGRR